MVALLKRKKDTQRYRIFLTFHSVLLSQWFYHVCTIKINSNLTRICQKLFSKVTYEWIFSRLSVCDCKVHQYFFVTMRIFNRADTNVLVCTLKWCKITFCYGSKAMWSLYLTVRCTCAFAGVHSFHNYRWYRIPQKYSFVYVKSVPKTWSHVAFVSQLSFTAQAQWA